MRSTARNSLVALALLLAGCAHDVPVPASLALPEPDARLTDPNWCGRGVAKAGDDAVVAGRRKENARACEAARNAAWNTLYADVEKARAELPGGSK